MASPVDPPATRAARRIWQRGLVALVAGALTLGLLEAGSYLFGRFEGPATPLVGGQIEQYGRHDPLLFWSLRPHALSPDGEPFTNALGLRGPEVPPVEPVEPGEPGELRILSLGESTTLAPRMAYEECYSAVLEELLRERAFGEHARRVRVVNAGVSGYTIFQGYRWLEHRGLDLDPDLVLLYFGFNDFLPVSFLSDRAGGDAPGGLDDWELWELRRTPARRLRAALLEHSNLFRGLTARRARTDRGPATAAVQTDPARPRVPPEDRRRVLELLRDLCRERGIQLVIVVPWYREFERHAPLLRQFADSQDLPLVDLPGLLPDRLTKPREDYFIDTVHPTPEGHRLIAEAIAEVLAEARGDQ